MARVAIYDVQFGNRGDLIAHVSGNGKVDPDDETTEGIARHVKKLRADGLRGKKLLGHLERSYTNGYMMARTVK